MKNLCILWMNLILALGAAAAQNMPEGQASISGRVLDVSNSPYPAEVDVFQIVIHAGLAHLEMKCSRNTNQDGAFTCPKLSGAKFIVQVLPQSRLGKQVQEAQDAAAGTIPKSLFYSNVTDLEEATPISLGNNEAGWAEVRVAESPAVEVKGTLTNRTPFAFFRLEAESGRLTLDTRIHPEYDGRTGRFVFSHVPAGHYQLTAHSLNFQTATLRFVMEATPVEGLLLSATPDVVLVSGQFAALPSGGNISELSLVSADGSTRDLNTSVKDGAFNFGPVPVGEYIVRLPLGQQVYVDSITVGGKSVDGSKFSVVPGQGTVHLELEVKGPSVPIRGSVQQWEGPAVSAEVIAQSEDSGEIYKVTTGKQRNFLFAGVKPGEYRLFAWPGIDTIEYRNPLVLKKYNDDSTEVRVDQDNLGGAIELSPIEKEH